MGGVLLYGVNLIFKHFLNVLMLASIQPYFNRILMMSWVRASARTLFDVALSSP